MSDVIGTGYGSSHRWKKDLTAKFKNPRTGCQEPATRFRCRDCQEIFVHYFDREKGIFEAMEYRGVTRLCPAVMQENGKSKN